jgi:glutamine amidotransferase
LLNKTEQNIVVIDYGVGNLGSVINMLKRVGATCKVSSSPSEIMAANKIILPGVGAFDHGMQKLKESGLDELLIKKSKDSSCQIMGICLGMQMLTEGSEEGTLAGLGLISGTVKKFKTDQHRKLKVPHMGWNIVKTNKHHYLLENLPEESRYYFVHSYYVSCNNPDDVLMTTHYGNEFVSAFQKKQYYWLSIPS